MLVAPCVCAPRTAHTPNAALELPTKGHLQGDTGGSVAAPFPYHCALSAPFRYRLCAALRRAGK